ncbi:amidase family protein [Phytohabitans kaempferiae]|uniref:Amidase family protein n=1 Tax=Phytohabitans kaempferiae TaxID=1620943 RepID=A0ABV6MA58_9ACTN
MSNGPATTPESVRTVWRVIGDPLVPATGAGPLTGHTVAVKDLYAVAGERVGAGNPAWLAAARTEPEHADVVHRLLDAGAAVRGIAHTDEFAYSLAGTNAHYGTPPNFAAPGRIPGGSSSGSASAVAGGQATIGLGTDTGGSIRVPAAYQGCFGIRTTHGVVDRTGLLPLASDFDAIGWLTRSAEVLQAVGEVLLPADGPGGTANLVVVPPLLALAEPEIAAAVGAWLRVRGAATEQWPLTEIDDWRRAFQTWQAYQAWQRHGGWLASRLNTLGNDVRRRFQHAATIDATTAASARRAADAARRTIRDLVGDRVLALPSVSSVAPPVGDGLHSVRDATMRLTCLAGLGGLPAVSLPLRTESGFPTGVCLVAATGRDRDLFDLAVNLA